MTAEARAVLAAALLDPAGPAAAARAVARLGEPELLAELATLQALPRAERVRVIVAEVRRALAPPTAGAVEAALADESAAVRAAARGEARVAPEVRRWLLRALTGGR